MKQIIMIIALALVFAVPALADRPEDFCEKHPDHKDCRVSEPNGNGFCPEGTVYIDTWGCVPY